MQSKINFDRDGLTLVGNLFTPDDFDRNGHYQAVIVQGSFTSVKEQMAGTYAEKFAKQGFVALSFDYAHYGESEGEPRQYEAPAEKLDDLEAAVTYLTDLPYVEAVGMVGVCTSASNGVQLAARDPRVKGLATIAAALFDKDVFTATYGEDGMATRREQAVAAKKKYDETGEATTITVYSETDKDAANYIPVEGAFDYYWNESRGNVPQYKNELDVSSWTNWLDFDALSQALSVTTPTIVVHSDESAGPDSAKAGGGQGREGTRVVRRKPLRLLRLAQADGQRRRERDPLLPHPPGRVTGRIATGTAPRDDTRPGRGPPCGSEPDPDGRAPAVARAATRHHRKEGRAMTWPARDLRRIARCCTSTPSAPTTPRPASSRSASSPSETTSAYAR
ncbi:alpha/beta hydrolase [Streptomyces pseudovenezuelae]|uniref:alpha/beta hydrolase n=1 Tax=Streptomyces pseudovenezuelae TaxID=67350 RepID=UPI002E353F8D|nr:alpha/beta hydrolase [Streptomyces pseudovenezuelae]